ncbi:hypothetical protein CVT91_06490 [Candidatus Atribacteria bacterium HGW-Atribacteria-1]|nr:MAG: hypothetical protein CVT91_06490 [Candidatus Atribacteria bacterium HGW-Atribacteria-1]
MNKYLSKLDSKYFLFFVLLVCVTLQMIGYRLLEPDSWYYIEGAKNLMNSKEYVIDCNSLNINMFPPLYSIYLMPYIYFIGYTELAITTANTILFIGSSFFIIKIVNYIYSDYKNLISAIFIIFITKFFHDAASENLLIPLLFFQVYYHLTHKKNLRYITVSIILFTLMLLAKNSSVLIIMPLIFYYTFEKTNKIKEVNWKIVMQFAFIFGVSFILSKLLNTSDYQSHPFKWGSGNYHYYDYIIQILSDFHSFFRPILFIGYPNLFPLIFGTIIFVSFLYIIAKVEKNALLFLSIFLGLFFHIFIFSNVWIENGIIGRFLFWLSLITLGYFLKYIFIINKHFIFKIILIFFIGTRVLDYSYKRYSLLKDYKQNDIYMGITIKNKPIKSFMCYDNYLQNLNKK